MPRVAIDYSALTGPVSQAEVTQYRTAAKQRPGYSTVGYTAQLVVLIVTLVFFSGFMLITLLGGILVIGGAVSNGNPLALFGLFIPLLLLAVFALLVFALVRAFGGGRKWETWLRAERFAAANQLVFSPMDKEPQYPGAIFQGGYGRVALDHFRSATDRFLDYGTYQYETGSGKSHATHRWGFLALALDRSLPHMVLDSTANNGLFGSNLAIFDKDQVLSLEGDFNRYFTLYCPKQYERDALYVFTPDLMALLIDNVAPFDVEIVDKWMFVYSAVPFDVSQPAVHHRLLSIVETVGAKTLTQTDRYSDERVNNFAANVVAAPGQRLKRKFPLAALIIILGVVLFTTTFWIWPVLALLFSR